jgi:hypothetical protein
MIIKDPPKGPQSPPGMREVEPNPAVLAALERVGARNPCPRCSNSQFMLLPGYFNQTIQPELAGGLVIGGPSLPTVVLICSRCGYLSQHALGVLGLLPATGGTR